MRRQPPEPLHRIQRAEEGCNHLFHHGYYDFKQARIPAKYHSSFRSMSQERGKAVEGQVHHDDNGKPLQKKCLGRFRCRPQPGAR